ncbi:unnamed protein product [Hymenolepis diminuta]|uniref:Coenzyme Q-binding protein COQ10 START domain-containing protein n=2 Tax=Hymenolepis diminuta TaxID=6216 RepID=A0A564Y090_HYMDI|nr:unnamed protein product [Hymenolepis diminuta]
MLVPPSFLCSRSLFNLKSLKFIANVRFTHNNPMLYDTRKIYREQRLLGYSSEQMFNIISDVEQYSEFLPWCLDSTIVKTDPVKGKLCRLQIGFYPFKESYDSWVTVARPSKVKSIATNSDLFEFLINEWKIMPGLPDNENTCLVELLVDFKFRSRLHSRISGLFFDQVINTMVGAFMCRATTLHGNGSIPLQAPKILEYSR